MERSGLQGRTAYLGAGLTLAFLLGVYFVYPVRMVVLILLTTMLFCVVIGAPVDYLARRGVARVWGLLVVAAGFFLVFLVAGRAVVYPLVVQAQQLVGDLPALLADLQALTDRAQAASGIDFGVSFAPSRLFEAAQGLLSELPVAAIADVGSGAANVLSLGLVVFLTGIYAVLQPTPLVNGFVALFPAGRRQRVREVLGKMYGTVQRWLLGQLVDMLILGVLSTVALWIIGIPFAVLLGLFSGLMAFIPYVGFVSSLVPPVLLALADDPINAVWVVLAYVLIGQVEADLIYPLVMSRVVSLHPAAVVFGIFVASLLFGFAGLLLAVPLIAALQVLVHELWIERMDKTGIDPNPPRESEKRPEEQDGPVRRALKALRRSRSV